MKLYQNITVLFAIWFLIVIIIFYFGFSSFPDSSSASGVFLNNLANWDGGHYNRIAKFGYQEKFQYAFFPLYPMTIRLLSLITQNYLLSSVIISVISAFFSLQIMYKLISDDFSKNLAEGAVWQMLFFPTSFFLLTAYSEGLFLLFAVSSFYFFKKKKFFVTALLIALASLTRVIGLAVMAAILIEIFLSGINRKNWVILLSPTAFLIYCLYLFQETHNPLYFIVAESHWQRIVSFPWVGFWETIQSLSRSNFINQYFSSFWDLIFAIFGLGIIIRGARFLPRLYLSYSLFALAIPLLTPSLSSVPRFLLPIFPIFIVIAKIKNKNFIFFYQTLSLMLLSAFAILYINGFWVS